VGYILALASGWCLCFAVDVVFAVLCGLFGTTVPLVAQLADLSNFQDTILIGERRLNRSRTRSQLVFIRQWQGIHRTIPSSIAAARDNYTLFLDVTQSRTAPGKVDSTSPRFQRLIAPENLHS